MKKLLILSTILMNLCPAFGGDSSDVSGDESSAAGAGAPVSPLSGQRRITSCFDHTPRSARKVADKRLRAAVAAVAYNEVREDAVDLPVNHALDSSDDTDDSDDELQAPLKAIRGMTEEERLKEKFQEKASAMLPESMGAVARIGFVFHLRSWMDFVRPITDHFENAHFMLNMQGLKPDARRMILDELIARIDANPDPSIRIQGADLVLRCIKIDDDFYYGQRALMSLKRFFHMRDVAGFEKYIVLAATSILNHIGSMSPKISTGESKVSSLIARASGAITPFQFSKLHASPKHVIVAFNELARQALEEIVDGANPVEKINAAVVLFKNSPNAFEDLSERDKKAFRVLKEHLRTRADLGDRFDLGGVAEVTIFERIKRFYEAGGR